MHRLNQRRANGDEGTVLVLVLVMTVILGLVAATLATYVAVGLRTSRVTDDRSERLAALDAGLRIGMERLKVDRSACSTSLTINDVNVTVSCAPVTDSSKLGPFEVTAATANGETAKAGVQAYTASGKRCADAATEKCVVMVNSWAVEG